MSNDTDIRISVKAKKKPTLEEMVKYLHDKKVRWDSHQEAGGTSSELMEKVGATSPAEVVAWGFDWESIRVAARAWQMKGTSCANENSIGNVWLTGENGEIAILAKKFPGATIAVKFEDECGNGICSAPDFEKNYTRGCEM